ncbi:hypothetical protein PGTUg99_000610 [Puccinia graminis f. sp. tritici]|uniref:Uncharacterized protein n=1 Tax=Puccinia graminis f. sp. tritici TaxID=56615 RepID=A0A5B0RCF5_PUCGR|nr:hypothetical protein PGTUg99_000610 [Puccinia graminis f. sp. tritici]
MSRTSQLGTLLDPPGGKPLRPTRRSFFLAFFVGWFVFFRRIVVGLSQGPQNTPGPSERRRITRIRPLNSQRPPRTPPSPSTTPDRRRTARIDSTRRRTTQGDPPRPRPLLKAPEASRSPPKAPAAPQDAPARP